MKKINHLLRHACVILCLSIAGCEGISQGDDPDRDPVSITGDSELVVENHSGDDATVYFDGQYIGKVSDDSSKTWAVPSGVHNVVIDNAERDFTETQERSTNLSPGSQWVISFDGWEAL
jgi:hypothetical protein